MGVFLVMVGENAGGGEGGTWLKNAECGRL